MLKWSLVKVIELSLRPQEIKEPMITSPTEESALHKLFPHEGSNPSTLVKGRRFFVEHAGANRLVQFLRVVRLLRLDALVLAQFRECSPTRFRVRHQLRRNPLLFGAGSRRATVKLGVRGMIAG